MSFYGKISSLDELPKKKRPKLNRATVKLTPQENLAITELRDGNYNVVQGLSFELLFKIFQFYESQKKYELVQDLLQHSSDWMTVSLSKQTQDPKLFIRKQVYMIGMEMYYRSFPMPAGLMLALFKEVAKLKANVSQAMQLRESPKGEIEDGLAGFLIGGSNQENALLAAARTGSNKLIFDLKQEKKQRNTGRRESITMDDFKATEKKISAGITLALQCLMGQNLIDGKSAKLVRNVMKLDPGRIPSDLESEVLQDMDAFQLLINIFVVRIEHRKSIKLYVNDFSE